MGRLSDARRLAAKAKELVAKNDVKVKEALDKAAGVVDSKTKGKYSEKIGGAVAKAKGAVDKLPDRASANQDPARPDPAGQIVNVEQAANWDGSEGEYWVAHQARFDTSILPHHHRLMTAAAIAPGERVLDIGCGNGITSRDAARATGPGGSVFAADLSGPMLGRAEQVAKDEGLANITFQQADAQVHPFEAGAFDVVISRFGVMFFNDPVAAFTNIGSALRPGGRLAMLVWQAMEANEWGTALRENLAMGRDLPVPPPGAPGPFALGDTGFTTGVLTAAGFTDVAFEASDQPFRVGSDAADAYGFMAGLQPVLMLLADLDDTDRAKGLDNLRATAAAHETADGVVFRSAAWVMTAHRP